MTVSTRYREIHSTQDGYIKALHRDADDYAAQYAAAIADLQTALAAVSGVRPLVQQDRLLLKEMEVRASATAIGGNEPQRKAYAQDSLLAHRDYLDVTNRLLDREQALADSENAVTIATERCRLMRALVEVCSGHLRAIA